jgi:uncharacterized membrane protein (UPF0127 family)
VRERDDGPRAEVAGRGLRRVATAAALAVALAAAPAHAKTPLPTVDVVIAGERFALEVARDPLVQARGLGGRSWIDPHGGMLFVFPAPRATAFVMRDCPVPIDVAFLDAAGRVISIHAMQPEPPRGPDESAAAYEARLRPYPSGLPARYAIETAGGRMRELGLRGGDVVELPAEVR